MTLRDELNAARAELERLHEERRRSYTLDYPVPSVAFSILRPTFVRQYETERSE